MLTLIKEAIRFVAVMLMSAMIVFLLIVLFSPVPYQMQ